MANPLITENTNPAIFETFAIAMNEELQTSLAWLAYSFGLAQTLEGEKGKYPAVVSSNNQYINLNPDGNYLNMNFWVASQEYAPQDFGHGSKRYIADLSVIFWAHQRDVYPGVGYRASENFKDDVVNAIDSIHIPNSNFRIKSVTDHPEKVYAGFSIKQNDSLYLMHPYLCCRVTLLTKVFSMNC